MWTPWITHSGHIQSERQSKQKYEISSSGWSAQKVGVCLPYTEDLTVDVGYWEWKSDSVGADGFN